jgi:tetratricopeptide (TPR) repeat protein/DNA-binding XRE family transcriptional regulator
MRNVGKVPSRSKEAARPHLKRRDDLVFVDGAKLQEYRKRIPLDVAAFAEAAGVRPATISRIEGNGVGRASQKSVGRMRRLFMKQSIPHDIELPAGDEAEWLLGLMEDISKQRSLDTLRDWQPQEVFEWVKNGFQAIELLREKNCDDLLYKHRETARRLYAIAWNWGLAGETRAWRERYLKVLAARSEPDAVDAKIAWFHEAAVHEHHAGQLHKATELCQQGLVAATEPRHRLMRGHFLHRLARIAQDLGDVREARRNFTEAINCKQGNVNEMASTRSALHTLTEGEGQFDKVIEIQRKCVAEAKGDFRLAAQCRLARVLNRVGEYDEARMNADGAYDEGCKSTVGAHERVAMSAATTSALASLLGDNRPAARLPFEKARAKWNRIDANGCFGDEADAVFDLAFLAQHLGEWSQSLELIQSALMDSSLAYSHLAEVRAALFYLNASDAEQANRHFRKAILLCRGRLFEKSLQFGLYHWLALAELGLGRYDEAKADAILALKRCPARGVNKMAALDAKLIGQQLHQSGTATAILIAKLFRPASEEEKGS